MSEQLLALSVDTTLDPLGIGATDTWYVPCPPAMRIDRFKIKRLAGDCTSYAWALYFVAAAGSATDVLFGLVDSATGIVPGSAVDDDNSYTTPPASYAMTQDAAGQLRIVVTTTGGTVGANTFRADVYCTVERGEWVDIAIPAP